MRNMTATMAVSFICGACFSIGCITTFFTLADSTKLSTCQAELPRNQTCELVAVPSVKEVE